MEELTRQEISFDVLITFNEDPIFKNHFPEVSEIINNSLLDKDLKRECFNKEWYLFWREFEIVSIVSFENKTNSYNIYVAEDESKEEIIRAISKLMCF